MSRKDYTNNLLLQYYQSSKDDTEVGEVLEYIETDGTQYWDTGLYADLNTGYEIGVSFNEFPNSLGGQGICGSRNVNYNRSNIGAFLYYGNADVDTGLLIDFNNISSPDAKRFTCGFTNLSLNKFYDIYNNKNIRGIKYDGVDVITPNTVICSDEFESTYTICMGRYNGSGLGITGLIGKVSYFKLFQNNVLIRDYVPFLDAHLRPCLYDRVTKTRLYHKNRLGDTVPTYKRWNKYNVEYLESTGTQYIDSGIILNNYNNIKLNINAKIDNSTDAQYITGVYSTNTTPKGIFYISNRAVGYANNAQDAQVSIKIENNDGNKYNYIIVYNNGIFNLSGSFVGEGVYTKLPTTNLYIFARNTDGTVSYGSGIYIYGYKISESNTLIRSFIPTIWYDDANNNHPTPCMYDEVYNKLYLNAGTGEFLAGKPTESVVYGADVDMSDLPSSQATCAVILNKSCDKPTSQYRYQYTTQRVLPVHDRIMGCVMSNVSEGTIAYYLDKSNSNYKFKGTYRGISSDGSPSVLTGADGDVFEEYMPFYIRVDKYTDSNNHPHKVYLISTKKFRGAHIYPLFRCGPGGKDVFIYYAGKFRSVLCNPDGTVKTHANTAPPAYANGDKLRSIAGAQPAGNIGRQNSRKAHGVTGGTNVHFLFGSMIKILMTIENANLNEQEAISDGFVNMASFNYSQMRLTGRTVGFGEGTGSIEADDADSSGVDYDIVNSWNGTAKNNHSRRIVAVCYRGLENPWGSQWEIEDGFQKNQNNLVDSVYLNTNLWFDRDETHDETVNIYSWINGTTYLYTTSETPAVNDRSYTNSSLASYKNVVTDYDSENNTITVANVVYTRATANDTTRVMRAWYNADNDIRCYCNVPNPAGGTFYTLPTCNVIYSTFHHSYGNFSQSGYWMTTDTDKYVSLDSTLTPPVDSQNVFPIDGTGNANIWVPHDFPKYDHYPSNFDDLTLFPLPPVWWNTSQLKSLSDRSYNNADAGPRGCFRGGSSYFALFGGCSSVYLYFGVTHASAPSGFRLAKSKKISESEL